MENQRVSGVHRGGDDCHVCRCEICLLHPNIKAALRRMQPPELRLYSQAEILQLLDLDISNAGESAKKSLVGSDESWWHLCTADRTFPFYFIPTLEFVTSLAAYLVCRVKTLCTEQCMQTKSRYKTSPQTTSCTKCEPTRPIRILECGAGTGLLAAHLLPRLHQLLQAKIEAQDRNHGSTSSIIYPQQKLQQQQQQFQQPIEKQEEHHEKGDEGLLECSNANGQENEAISYVWNECNKPKGVSAYTQRGENHSGTVSASNKRATLFSYFASEPREELQWCPSEIVATRDGCRLAIQHICPQVVICCWMPFNVDWTEVARRNCCACCNNILREGDIGSGCRQHGCPCLVQEYILIGHAEGGLVGRPFETWGLHCHDTSLLPRGVDYEVSEESPQCCSNSAILRAAKASFSAAFEDSEKNPGCRKRSRSRSSSSSEVSETGEWQPANAFSSIPPERSSEKSGDQNLHAADKEGMGGGEVYGMKLAPLQRRPYYRDGFVRLPPLPSQGSAVEENSEKTEEDLLLQQLQRAQQLSRFDSLHNIRSGCPSGSRVVVFRRINENTAKVPCPIQEP